MAQPKYSEAFKKSVVQKLLTRGTQSVTSIVEESGVSESALYEWKAKFAYNGGMKKIPQRPKDRDYDTKLKSVGAYDDLPEAERGEFLRKEGLHVETIEQWRKLNKTSSPLSSCPPQAESPEKAAYELKLLQKEQELQQKNKELLQERQERLQEHQELMQEREESQQKDKTIAQISKELLRHQKALAETAALLILKKKADLIWGTEDEK